MLNVSIDPYGEHAEELGNLLQQAGVASMVYTAVGSAEVSKDSPKSIIKSDRTLQDFFNPCRSLIPIVLVIGGLAALLFIIKKLFE